MSNFYQSLLWRRINTEIYKKPFFELSFCGKQYRGTIKQQKMASQEFRRAMIHGLELDSNEFSVLQLQQLQQLQRDHKQSGDLFLQLGIINPLCSYKKEKNEEQEALAAKKIAYIERDLLSWYGLLPTVREHMPHATIVIPTKQVLTEQVKLCSEGGRRMYNKGLKAGLSFVQAKPEQRKQFWKLRYSMSYDKGFSVLPEQQFISLMQLLYDEGCGYLFLALQDGVIVSGSVCVQGVDKELIYLYGATDRAFGALGAHYWLTIHIATRAYHHDFTSFDLFGIAAPGATKDHPLQGVTRFKQSFGGSCIVYTGSYDLVCSSRGYRAFSLWRKFRK